MDRFYDSSEDYYLDVSNIMGKDFTINIQQDRESFLYINKEGEEKNISMKELISLKNKLHNINENQKEKEKEHLTTPKREDNEMKIKRRNLLFFKKLITNLELIINEYMKTLRNKGSSLDIKITIKVKNYDDIKYYLGGKEIYFKKKSPKENDGIKDFLIKAKNDYIILLNNEYKQKMNIRFMHGKQFRSMMKHLETGYEIKDFLRYILNFTNNNRQVKVGEIAIDRSVKDWINENQIFEEDSLKNMNTYINTLFKNNNQRPYDKMTIIQESNKDKEYKGIYSYECDMNSMEEFIIKLFWDKLNTLPIAQNVLITSKETSEEEIQAFIYRAILCNYNTLFVIEISDSFTEHQQNIMNLYIEQSLAEKNKDTKCEKSKTEDYMIHVYYLFMEKNIKRI